jgi:lipoprotein-anchoring transpeptidase ErfK/SrfK
MSKTTMRFRPAIPLVLLVVLGGAFTAAQLAFAAAPAESPGAPAPELQPVSASAQAPAQVRKVRRTPPNLLAEVHGSVALSDRPGGPAAFSVGPTTEFGSPRVLSVAAHRGAWLGVVTTERPNGQLAWVRRGNPALRLRTTRWSLVAHLSSRTLTLRRNGHAVRRLSVAVGAAGSATPTGRFAVTDKLSGSNYGPYYGCCILALSGHQTNTPAGWKGGDRLAIHGTSAPGTIGTAASAGCLRAADADLEVLMRTVPVGTPVLVRG